VLIVDNQADAREWLAEWLRRKHEFDVETACDGEEAIRSVTEAQGNYDVVLMDLLLGEGPDGIKTMQRIQARYPGIETIIITAFGGIEEGVRAMKEGAYRYVLKPLNREELVVYVRHAAERRKLKADLQLKEQKQHWLQGLLSVSQALTSKLDLEPTLDIIVRKLQELLTLDTCTIGLFDADRTTLSFATERGLGQKVSLLLTNLPSDLVTQLFASSDIIVMPEILNPALKKALVRSDLRSFVIVPLRGRNEEPLGTINMGSVGQIALASDQRNLLRVLADQAAIAIENARLFEQAQERTKVANTLREVAIVVNSTLDLDEVLQLVLAQLRPLIPFDTASIQLLQGEEVRIVACEGFKEQDRNKVLRLAFPKEDLSFPNWTVITKREPLLLTDTRESHYHHFCDEADVYSSGHIRSWLGVPMLHRDEVIGILSIESSAPHRYTRAHIDLGVSFANQVVSAVANARLYKGSQSMLDLVEDLTKQLELQTVLKRIVEDAVNKEGIIGADIAIIYLYNPEKGVVDQKPVYAGALRYPDKIYPPFESESAIYNILRSREPRISDRVVDDMLLSRTFVESEGVESVAAFPIVVNDQPAGVMLIGFLATHSWTEAEVYPMNQFAQTAAIAIQSARQFEVINERLAATRNAAVVLSAMSAWAHDAAIDTFVLRNDAKSLQNYILEPSPKALEILHRIENIAEKIATLIPDAPADLDQRHAVDVAGVFRRILDQHETVLGEKKIRIDSRLEYLPLVEANEWLLAEALNHLIHNAAKFMGSGGKLSLSGSVEGKRLYVTVSDSGPGIAAEEREHIFKRRTSSMNGEGSGVGLMLTRLYLNACDGDIALDHSDNNGTAFVFHLPLADSQ